MGKQTKAPWKYTPGPLKVMDMGTHFAVVDEVYENVIAESVLYREDAQLYAAAPDMLEALHTCKVQLAPIIEAGASKVTQTMWLLVCDAIAKAEEK